MDLRTRALALHRENRGKVGIVSKIDSEAKTIWAWHILPG